MLWGKLFWKLRWIASRSYRSLVLKDLRNYRAFAWDHSDGLKEELSHTWLLWCPFSSGQLPTQAACHTGEPVPGLRDACLTRILHRLLDSASFLISIQLCTTLRRAPSEWGHECLCVWEQKDMHTRLHTAITDLVFLLARSVRGAGGVLKRRRLGFRDPLRPLFPRRGSHDSAPAVTEFIHLIIILVLKIEEFGCLDISFFFWGWGGGEGWYVSSFFGFVLWWAISEFDSCWVEPPLLSVLERLFTHLSFDHRQHPRLQRGRPRQR